MGMVLMFLVFGILTSNMLLERNRDQNFHGSSVRGGTPVTGGAQDLAGEVMALNHNIEELKNVLLQFTPKSNEGEEAPVVEFVKNPTKNTAVFQYRDIIAIKPSLARKMEDYVRFHNEEQTASDKSSYRYIILRPSGQLCNHIRGVLSAFLIALLTNRILKVEGFAYGETSFLDLFEDPGFRFFEKGRIMAGSTRRIQLESVETFACSDIRLWPEEAIYIAGPYYVGNALFKNHHFFSEMTDWFHDDDIARPLLAFLFQPRKDILETALRFKDSLMQGRKVFVTYHIRSEFPVTDAEWQNYRNCAVAMLPNGVSKQDARVFVATDSLKMRGTVQVQLAGSAGGIDDPAFYMPEEFLVGRFKKGLQQALVDILIASFGDHIFLSPFSSFSRVIMLYSQTPNTFVVTDHIMPEADPHRNLQLVHGKHCFRFYVKEPCGWHGHLHPLNEMLRKTSCFTPNMLTTVC